MSAPAMVRVDIPREAWDFAVRRAGRVAVHGAMCNYSVQDIGAVCYLQGVRDVVELVERRGWPKREQEDQVR